ncbi:hypothetical protein [Arthrobacter sp. M4]|uniref:hypothetical protein n=1 Tax=Arthrobacter sp. M4 TaxID=218160 RepID=UPI001CDB8B11|nr:hypothetical protein [Arthrobacter sp. M4]MCA4133994.1 hypothetical protein [Arthrobacter sp. M4]
MKRNIGSLFIAILVAAGSIISAPAATAAPRQDSWEQDTKATPAEVAELKKLQKIAGKPVTYQPSLSESDNGLLTTASVDLFVCELHPSVVHLRSSSGNGAVGAKPYTKCLAGTPSQITHDSTLYMVEWFGLSYVSLASKSQTAYNTLSMTLTSLEWWCRNTNNSKFVQKTNGSSVQAGRTYYASVSTVQSTLSCGK